MTHQHLLLPQALPGQTQRAAHSSTLPTRLDTSRASQSPAGLTRPGLTGNGSQSPSAEDRVLNTHTKGSEDPGVSLFGPGERQSDTRGGGLPQRSFEGTGCWAPSASWHPALGSDPKVWKLLPPREKARVAPGSVTAALRKPIPEHKSQPGKRCLPHTAWVLTPLGPAEPHGVGGMPRAGVGWRDPPRPHSTC